MIEIIEIIGTIVVPLIYLEGCLGGDDEPEVIEGCMDNTACNYNENATEDNGSCIFEVDCAGECGGSALPDSNGDCCESGILDECGVCNETGAECWFNETKIGNTYYDLQSNASLQRRILRHSNGTISVVWTMSQKDTPYPDRGTGYNFFNGSEWSTIPVNRVESQRTGWPSIIPIGDKGEAIISHSGDSGEGLSDNQHQLVFTKRDTAGVGSWTESNIDNSNGFIWNRSAASQDGITIHVIAFTNNEESNGKFTDDTLIYYRSTDSGNNWETGIIIPGIDMKRAKDTYVIETRGDIVAIAIFNSLGKSMIVKSIDNGVNWQNPKIFQNFPIDNYEIDQGFNQINNGNDVFIYSTNESGCLLIDDNNIVHVFCGLMGYGDSDLTDENFTYIPGSNGIKYWNELMPEDITPVKVTIFPEYTDIWDSNNMEYIASVSDETIDIINNTDIEFAFYNGMGLTSYPSVGIDNKGNLFVCFSAVTDISNGNQLYRHIFIIISEDNGTNWSVPVDVTPHYQNNGQVECVFPHMERNVDDKIRIVYQKDLFPSTYVLPGSTEHPFEDNSIVYLEVDTATLLSNTRDKKINKLSKLTGSRKKIMGRGKKKFVKSILK
jgi:hypothetical protein